MFQFKTLLKVHMTKSIGAVARGFISANPTMKNEELLALVKAEFPEAKTSVACIGWYKSKMKKEAKVSPVEVERTEAMIEEEIEMLQLELAELKEAKAKALVESKAELLAKLKEIEELEAATAE